jgi:hypothetical protein
MYCFEISTLLLPPAVSFISFFVLATKTQTSLFIKMDEYDEMEEENITLIVTIYSALLMSVYTDFSTAPVTCNPSIFDQRLDWANFVDRHGAVLISIFI